jgi:hypothetical protein
MKSYRDSDAYQRSNRVRPDTGKPLWPLAFADRPVEQTGVERVVRRVFG